MNLLPCPFCGGEARLCYPHQRTTTEAMCLTCGALVPGQDDTHAAEAWNLRRAAVPASDALGWAAAVNAAGYARLREVLERIENSITPGGEPHPIYTSATACLLSIRESAQEALRTRSVNAPARAADQPSGSL